MAVTHLFDTKYYESGDNAYRIIIGDSTGTVTDTVSEMSLLAPGMQISWRGNDTMSKPIMGSSLSMTAILNDTQLATIESMVKDTNEGDIFCLFFTDDASDAKPYWYGHLLKETVSIEIKNEGHVVDMSFTDGLGSLRGAIWRDGDGDSYTGRKKLSFWLREIVSKLPAYEGYKDYITSASHLNLTSVPLLTELAWPDPSTTTTDTYDEKDGKLDSLYVRADTFNKPKKTVNRIRNLDVPLDYLNAADVLEDICICFGATAAIVDGRLTLACRLDMGTLKSAYHHATYDYDPSGDSWTITHLYNNSSGFYSPDADSQYAVVAGAVRAFSMPISEVHITHEEGGSDALALDGVHHLDHGRGEGYNQGIFNVYYNEGIRKDIKYIFGPTLPTVDLPHLQQPATITDYLGFPSRTLDDIEFQSGQQMRLQFGGNFRVGNQSLGVGATALNKVHVGSVVIVRVRIQFTTTDDVSYRLSRTVHTHAKTDGALDFINIDNVRVYLDGQNNNQVVVEDRHFFRKLYNDLEWVKDDAGADYTDAWYEIIVPHDDNDNAGDDYGAPMVMLTEEYGGQPSYAPLATQIKGDNSGPGVILEEEDDATLMQYFQEDITVQLPYNDADNTDVLDFESFYFEMGAQEYEHDAGPRGNAAAETGWLGDTPLWRSAYADGSGGTRRYTGAGTEVTLPEFFHFTGLRVFMGDGSESSDLTTKATGGDGYEVISLGSTRIGSRASFVNHHVNGTVWGKKKDSNTFGDFITPDDWNEKWQWRGHRASEVGGSQIPTTYFDSIHRYYADSYLQLFGSSRELLSMAMTHRGSSDSFLPPFQVFRMKQLSADNDTFEYFIPVQYSWTLNDGVQGNFLKVGQNRDLSTITEADDRPVRGGGGIIGMPPGTDDIGKLANISKITDLITVTDTVDLDAQVVAITANSEKVGITSAQATAITNNSAKVGITSAQATKLDGIAVNATANDTDANLKDRANHTGTQVASTISDFQDKVSENTDVVTNKADIATDREDAEAFNFFLPK